jgi:diguanylate cyclase (GGDEF)-like protein
VFLACGLIVGVLTQRQELHSQELERISVYDPLTGVYSSSYLLTRLEEETRRRERYGGEVALLLLEIDDLKAFSDTFGTHRGDLLLAHLAEILRISVRNTDVLARHTGGTFGLICPHCGPSEAAVIAERLAKLVEETEFEGDELEPVTRHTMSVGMSTYPDPASDVSGLLEGATVDLQAAKATTSGS